MSVLVVTVPQEIALEVGWKFGVFIEADGVSRSPVFLPLILQTVFEIMVKNNIDSVKLRAEIEYAFQNFQR